MAEIERKGVYLHSDGTPVEKPPDVIRPGTNALIFNERGEVLLEKRADNGFWGMPGGSVDKGESVEHAMVREVFEETGLHVSIKRLVGIYSDPEFHTFTRYPSGDVVHYVTTFFECERRSGKLRISAESTDIGYFPLDAMPDRVLLSHHIRMQDAMAGRTEPFIR